MNPSLIKTEFLATGQSAPFTGNWVNTALCKNGFIVTYTSGGSVDIEMQGKSEFNQNPIFLDGGSAESFAFYNQTGVGPGYAAPLFFDSPISQIRIAATGSNAAVWAYITYQN